MEIVEWCSLFCDGSPAEGTLDVPLTDADGGVTMETIPVCDYCGKLAMERGSIERDDDE